MLEGVILKKEVLLIALFLMNVLTYKTFAIDKKRAIKNKRRISERKLLFLGLFFGGLGGYLGMKIHHHKTKKLKFKLLLRLGAGFTILTSLLILQI